MHHLKQKKTMKKSILLTLLISILLMVSCSKKTDYGQPNVDSENIQKDYMEWWSYHNNNIILSSDFLAIDNDSKMTTKESFLKDLTSGDYIPLKLISKNANTYYQLFKLNNNANKDIGNTIKNIATVSYKHNEMEGKNFPKFQFTDLNGVVYNNENTMGKIIVLKCWFIACKACVEEFPELNDLVEMYQDREDVIFISLAYDSDAELKEFLLRKPFSYKVASVPQEFMENELSINAYPTHFIIDETGTIKKVVNSANELISELDASGILYINTTQLIPPPPPPTPAF